MPNVKANKNKQEKYENRVCPNCSKKFSKVGSFRRHLRSHLDLYSYVCKYCLLGFRCKDDLISHIKDEHFGSQYSYICEKCERRFKSKVCFNQHKMEHSIPPPYSCHKCKATFPTFSRFNRHLSFHTLLCPVCHQPFTSDKSLRSHLGIQHPNAGGDDFQYQEVKSSEEENSDEEDSSFDELDIESGDDSYTSEDDEPKVRKPKKLIKRILKEHYVCFVCERKFPNQRRLDSHLKRHPVFQCLTCPKFFASEELLKTHRKDHDVQNAHIFDDLRASLQISTPALQPSPLNVPTPLMHSAHPVNGTSTTNISQYIPTVAQPYFAHQNQYQPVSTVAQFNMLPQSQDQAISAVVQPCAEPSVGRPADISRLESLWTSSMSVEAAVEMHEQVLNSVNHLRFPLSKSLSDRLCESANTLRSLINDPEVSASFKKVIHNTHNLISGCINKHLEALIK